MSIVIPPKQYEQNTSAFTLIEVLISISILSFVFVAAASYITATMKSTQQNQQTLIANQYADELMEWVSSQQEADWDTFISKSTTTQGYCFNEDIRYNSLWPQASTQARDNPCGDAFDGIGSKHPQIYNRELTVSANTANTRATVTITVSWKSFGSVKQVTRSTIFSQFSL